MRLPLNYREDVKRSVRNMSLEKRTTFNAGVIIPILFEKIYPHDKFDVNFATLLQSNPLVAPLMGEFALQVNAFFEPDSNLYGWMDNNTKSDTSEILSKKRHTLGAASLPFYNSSLSADAFVEKVRNPVYRGSLLDYIGFPVGSIPPLSWYAKNDISSDRVLAYLDIIRTYYMPNQTQSVPYVEEFGSDDAQLRYLDREDIDGLFRWLRFQTDGVNFTNVGWTDSASDHYFPTLSPFFNCINSGALFCSPYMPDMMRNLLLKVDSSKIKVDTSDGSFSIDTLRFQNKLQRLVDRYDISGGRFSSWLKTVWGSSAGKRLDIPQLLHSTTIPINPSNITSTANTYTETAGSEIGQLAGNVNQSHGSWNRRKDKMSFYCSVGEPGTLVVCVSLIPKVDYSQGFDKGITDILFADDYKPQFAQLGYQDVPRYKYTAVPSIVDANESTYVNTLDDVVGKQIAWMDLMSNVNRVHGEFADGGYYETWVLRRRYSYITQWSQDQGDIVNPPNVVPVTVHNTYPSYYVDPRDYTYMFANTSYADDNFMFQIGFRIRAVRPIGKRFMPTLE